MKLFEFPVFNNCDELVNFMVENYDHPYIGEASFQGDRVIFDGLMPNISVDTIIVASAKHPRAVFLVSPWHDGEIELSIITGKGNLDQKPGAILPAYVKDELIATIRGEW